MWCGSMSNMYSSKAATEAVEEEASGDPLERAQRQRIDQLRHKFEGLNCKSALDEQEVVLVKDEPSRLASITIRSEGARNALSGKMIGQLTGCLDQLYAWPEGRGVLIQGHNGTFCSGSDLVSALETTRDSEAGLQLAELMQYNLMRLQCLPMISVAWIEGYALGGGAELALGADLRIMSSSAKIGFVHAKMGVCCGWGGGSRLVELLGPARATDLLASGRLVGAEEALSMGLANGLASTSAEMAEFMASRTVGSNDTIRALKSMINSARLLPPSAALRAEGQLFASTWGKGAHLRALEGTIKHKQQ